MHSVPLRSTFAFAVVLAAGLANSALAQTPHDLKARCDQLTSYFDRYGVGRSGRIPTVRAITRESPRASTASRANTRKASRPWKLF